MVTMSTIRSLKSKDESILELKREIEKIYKSYPIQQRKRDGRISIFRQEMRKRHVSHSTQRDEHVAKRDELHEQLNNTIDDMAKLQDADSATISEDDKAKQLKELQEKVDKLNDEIKTEDMLIDSHSLEAVRCRLKSEQVIVQVKKVA